MTSERRIDANRRNAMKSTGPNTAEGKRRSSRNALRHGLSRPRWLEAQESVIATEIAEFTQKLVGEDASPTEIALARAAAEAQFELSRVRQHREALLASLEREVSADRVLPDNRDRTPTPNLIDRLDRYQRRALFRRDRALDKLSRFIRLPVLG
jgi:hypothetical protein